MTRPITFPQDLIDSFRSNEVIGIIGSGLSHQAGFPNWKETLELMISECQRQLVSFTQSKELKSLLRKGLYPEVAEECADLLRGDLYRNFIQNTFGGNRNVPTKVHELLLDLPLSAILTTNYDTLIERTYAKQLRSNSYPFTFTSKNLAQLSQLCTQKRFFIFKMHGDAEDIETVVLRKKDYQKVIHSSPLYQASMSNIFATRTALFIGYGLRDHDLDLILGAHASLYKEYGRRHYALFPDAGNVLRKSFSENYNIRIIPYSSKDGHKELQLMMGELSRQVKALPPSTEDEELQRLKQLIDIESRYCEKLGTYIELERAKYLRSRRQEARFTPEQQKLIQASIQHWEILADEKAKLLLGTIGTAFSHEFKNVLSSIQKLSAKLASQAPEGPLRESANGIISAINLGKRLVRTIQSLGENAAIERDGTFEINDLLTKMADGLSAFLGNDVRITFVLFTKPLWITAIPQMFEQVMMNLLVNARDAISHKGLITIATNSVSITNEYLAGHPDALVGSFVCISVSDNGCGISQKDLPRIFEPFFSSKEKKGTGLGLCVTKEIVRRNGGWIEVKTRLRHGSTFSVFLPEVDAPL